MHSHTETSWLRKRRSCCSSEHLIPVQTGDPLSTGQTSSPVTSTYESIGPLAPAGDGTYTPLQIPRNDYEEAPWSCCANKLELKGLTLTIMLFQWTCAHVTQTRKLRYRKDDRATRHIYMGVLKNNFGSPWLRPRLLCHKFLMGFTSDRSYEQFGQSQDSSVPGFAHTPFSPSFLMGFCSGGVRECISRIWSS